jgi:hypothetical protein
MSWYLRRRSAGNDRVHGRVKQVSSNIPAGSTLRVNGAALLSAVGVLLVASQAALAHLSPAWTQASLSRLADAMPLMVLLALPAGLLLASAPLLARTTPTRGLLLAMVLTGLTMRVVWYGVPVVIDDDYFRYLWDGAVLAHGHNPYAMAPKAALDGLDVPAGLVPLAARARDVLAGINFPELTSIYPGTAQIAFWLAYLLAPLNLDGLRLVFLAGDAASLALLVVMLRETGRSPLLAALYWANPLIVWVGHGTGHTEAVLAPLLLGACLAAWRGRDVLAAVLLALAVGVKLWPVLLVPILARLSLSRGRGLVAPAVAFVLVAGVLLAPLALSALAGLRSGLVAYSDHWWVNNGPFSWVSWWVYQATGGAAMGQRALRAALALATGGLALWLAWRPVPDLASLLASALAIAAVTFYAAPAQFPWYALWFLPLAVVVDCRPLVAASATLAIYYASIPLGNQGLGHWHHYGLAFLHALPVWAWLAWRARPGRAAERDAAGVTAHPVQSPSSSLRPLPQGGRKEAQV